MALCSGVRKLLHRGRNGSASALLALLPFTLACVDANDELAPMFDSEVLLRVDVGASALPDDPITHVGVRAWDETHRLVLDDFTEIDRYENSRYFRFFVDPDFDGSVESRTVRVEVELFSASMCPRGREIRTYRFENGQQLPGVAIEDDPAHANCISGFVEMDGPGRDCEPTAPCASPWQASGVAFSRLATDEEGDRLESERQRLVVVYIRGGTIIDDAESFLARRRRIFRAWPGTVLPEGQDEPTPPILRGNRDGDEALDATLVVRRGHQTFELDGLIFEGSSEGVAILRRVATGGLRNCALRSEGTAPLVAIETEDSEVDVDMGGGLLVLEHNVFEDAEVAVEIREGNENWRILLQANRFTNVGTGIRVESSRPAIEVRANTFCNARDAALVSASDDETLPVLLVQDNAFIDGSVGVRAVAQASSLTLQANSFAGQRSASLELQTAAPIAIEQNLFETLPPAATGNLEGRVEREGCFVVPSGAGGVCRDFPACGRP